MAINAKAWIDRNWRGVMTAVTIGAAALFVSDNYGGPQVLYALLLGMAFHFLSEDPLAKPGIEFSSKFLLRFGVGLLGVRITADQLALLSPAVLALVISGVFGTVACSMLLNRFVKWPRAEGALAGASVAVCGASAAAALALVIDKKELREQALLAIIVTVTALSTLAMVTYPFLIQALGLTTSQAGIVIGGTIHDVAQVVGAGAMLGQEALETGTMVKMLRVAMLVPMIFLFAFLFGAKAQAAEGKKVNPFKQIPLFLVGFVVLAAINVAGFIPAPASKALAGVSQLCILIAIGALGVKTSLGKLREVGWSPIILMAADSVFLLGWILLGILILK